MKRSISFACSAMRYKFIAMATLSAILTGCASHPSNIEKRNGYYANHAHKAIGQNERVRFLILHYTALDESDSLKTLTEEQVSAHYLVPAQPTQIKGQPVVWQLVAEDKRAWHAGASFWNGRTNLNDSSIGIEIVNKGFTEDAMGHRTWYPYPEKQVEALIALTKDIVQRYQITPDNVLAHSDIAPLRKEDPGKLFPWERLAAAGIGAWPDPLTVTHYLAGRAPDAPADVSVIQALLKQYGYDHIPQNGVLDKDTQTTISAFQMHFRPSDISGHADAETEAIAHALIDKYRKVAAVAVEPETV